VIGTYDANTNAVFLPQGFLGWYQFETFEKNRTQNLFVFDFCLVLIISAGEK
jgi:hypothetical protein